ncbi:MAG: DUF805 domain-containing protein, partial [Psychrobacter sp.]|nr:DUF805 domain-containing protein [Psychrobacter sp.]
SISIAPQISGDEPASPQLGSSHQRFLNKFKKTSMRTNAQSASTSDAYDPLNDAISAPTPDYYSPPTTLALDQSFDHTSYNTSNWYSLNGRIGRIQYLAYGIIWGLLLSFIYAVVVLLGSMTGPSLSGMILMLVFILMLPFLIYMYIFLPRRRLHDLGKSGWWLLLLLVPIANLIMLLYLYFGRGQEGFNDYGLPPAPYTKVEFWLAMLVPIFSVLGIIAVLMTPSYFEEIQQEAMADILRAEKEAQNNGGATLSTSPTDSGGQATNKISDNPTSQASSPATDQAGNAQSQNEEQVAAAMAGTDTKPSTGSTSDISYEEFMQEAESTIYREPTK